MERHPRMLRDRNTECKALAALLAPSGPPFGRSTWPKTAKLSNSRPPGRCKWLFALGRNTAQFETIHPYHDGNGRTGRLLMPLMLAAEGYPPLYLSGALLRAKSQYYAALASVQLEGEWGPWLELLGHAVVESCDESISIAEDLLALAERWEQELRSYRAHSATRRLPRFLIGHPVLSVQQAAAGLSISVPAANAALNNGRHRPARLRTRRKSKPRNPNLSPRARSTVRLFSSLIWTCSLANSSSLRRHSPMEERMDVQMPRRNRCAQD